MLPDASSGHRAASGGRPRRVQAPTDESEDQPLPDATWEYLENATSIHVRGTLGSDEAAERLLNVFAARMPAGAGARMNEKPIAEQVAMWNALQRASKISTLRHVAANTPLGELTRACDEVVCVVVGYLVMIDAAPYLRDDEPAWDPPVLCEILNIDPSALAYYGLLAASFKRDPEYGAEVSELLASWRGLADCLGGIALAKVNGRVPRWRPCSTATSTTATGNWAPPKAGARRVHQTSANRRRRATQTSALSAWRRKDSRAAS